jgi:hypothetical protein
MVVTYEAEDPGAADTRDKGYVVVKWGPLSSIDEAQPLEVPVAGYISVQVMGTFGFKGEVTFWGGICEDQEFFVQLPDEHGDLIRMTAPGLKEIGTRTRWFQPRVKPGDGTTSLDVYLFAAR